MIWVYAIFGLFYLPFKWQQTNESLFNVVQLNTAKTIMTIKYLGQQYCFKPSSTYDKEEDDASQNK